MTIYGRGIILDMDTDLEDGNGHEGVFGDWVV